MSPRVRLRGKGVAEVPAYGIADAEITLEKELTRAWPGAILEVPEVRRTDAARRIVETFELLYRLTLDVDVDPASAPDEPSARKAALVTARRALMGTRFARVEWEKF